MCAETENRPVEQKREEPVRQPDIQGNYDKGDASNELKKRIIQLMLRTTGSPLREVTDREKIFAMSFRLKIIIQNI